MRFKNFTFISNSKGYRLPSIILIFGAIHIGISNCDISEDRPASGDSWSEAKDFGPLSYSIEQNEGRYENFKTKTIFKGCVKHNATGSRVDFRTAMVEELTKCPPKGEILKGTLAYDLDPKRLLCYNLIQQSVIEATKLKKRKIDITIREGMNPKDDYYKLIRYKARVETNIPPLSVVHVMRMEINSLPLKDSTVPKQLDDLEYPVYGDHYVIAISSPYKVHCSGDILQAGSPFEHLDDENVRMSMSELEYFAERFKAETTGNFTFEAPKMVCKIDTTSIPLMESAPFLFKDFQLHFSFRISKRESCPRISMIGEVKTWPIEGLFGVKFSNEEECDPNAPNRSNMTFKASTSSTFFPSFESKTERSVVMDTSSPKSWTEMFLLAFTGGLDEKKMNDLVASSLLEMASATGVDVDKLSKKSGGEVLTDIISEAQNIWATGPSDPLPTKKDRGSKHIEL